MLVYRKVRKVFRKVRYVVLKTVALAPIEGKILLWRCSTQKIGMIAGIASKKNATHNVWHLNFLLKNLAGFFEFLHVVDQLQFVYNLLYIAVHDVA